MDSYLDGEILYKKGFDGTLLRSLNDRKAKKGNRRSTWRCLSYIYYWHTKSIYFWTTIKRDCIYYIKKYHKCQFFSNKINVSLIPFHIMIVLLLFAMQGMDVTNPINPKPSNKYQFILVAVDSFIEWIKTASYVYVT